MNYKLHYDLLIEKYGTWEKPKGIYTERHRKFPGYLGGKYVKGNAFYVPARVHYLAHLLWAKITEHEEAWAAVDVMMSGLGKRTSRMYANIRVKMRPVLVEAGRKAGLLTSAKKTGVHGMTREQRVEVGKRGGSLGGKRTAELGYLKIAGSAAGKLAFKNGTGIFAMSKEDRINVSKMAGNITKIRGHLKIAGQKSFEKKAGFHAFSIEEKKVVAIKAGKAGGFVCKELGKGVCGISSSERKVNGSIGGKVTGKLPWWYNKITDHCTRSYNCPGEGYERGRKSWKL